MLKNRTIASAFALTATLAIATPAHAGQQNYRINSNEETTINLDICSPSVELHANGDDDTDLDFWVYDNNGNLIHTDTDSTDLTFYTIQSNAGNGRCLPYRLKVKNYGDVYNEMTLRLTDQGNSGGGGGGQTGVIKGGGGGGRTFVQQIRSGSNSNETHTLNLCASSVYLEARGDGDTDLDFWIYDNNGNQIHEDTDSTDITFATINTGRANGNCVQYSLRIRNYGDVYNNVELKLTDQ